MVYAIQIISNISSEIPKYSGKKDNYSKGFHEAIVQSINILAEADTIEDVSGCGTELKNNMVEFKQEMDYAENESDEMYFKGLFDGFGNALQILDKWIVEYADELRNY